MKKTLLVSIYFLLCIFSIHAQSLYCVTSYEASPGNISKFNPSTNTLVAVKSFNYATEGGPIGHLVQANDGKLYGVTMNWATTGNQSIFSFNPSTLTYTKIWDFDKTTGMLCIGLMLANDGKLYGMTGAGGSMNYGVIFSFDPSTSTYQKLKDFNGTEGAGGAGGTLLQASDGKMYGIGGGGSNNMGVIFSFDPISSSYTKLKDFNGDNGRTPCGTLIEARDGKLYGMTTKGGDYLGGGVGVIFSFDPSSSVLEAV